jgi:hypothetical protein
MPSAGVTGRTAQEAEMMHYASMIEECKREEREVIIEKDETQSDRE